MENEGTIRMINYLLKTKDWSDARRKVELLPESKIKTNFWKVILKNYLETGRVESAQEIAKNQLKRDLTVDEIENSLMNSLEEGLLLLDGAQEIAKNQLKRDLTVDEIENYFMNSLEDGLLQLDSAQKMTNKYLKRDLTVDELEILLEPCLKKKWSQLDLATINKIIELLPIKNKRRQLRTFMKIYLAVDEISGAEKIADRLNELGELEE